MQPVLGNCVKLVHTHWVMKYYLITVVNLPSPSPFFL